MTPTTNELEVLVTKWHADAAFYRAGGEPDKSVAYDRCADELAALTREQRENDAIAAAFREVTGPNGASISNDEIADYITKRSKEIMANALQQEAQGAVAWYVFAGTEHWATLDRSEADKNRADGCQVRPLVFGDTIPPAPVDVRVRAALQQIADWKLPPTKHRWGCGAPMSYEDAFGTNGARDYIRQVANDALALLDGQPAGVDDGKLLDWIESNVRCIVTHSTKEHPDGVVVAPTRTALQAALGGEGRGK